MVMPLIHRNRSVQLYADAISAIWAWWDLVTDPSYALQQELDIWEILQRDPKCYQGIQERLNDVAGPSWRVFPFNNSKSKGEKFLASWAEGMLRRIPHFADARKRLAQAVFRGQSTELILGRREFIKPTDESPAQNFWVPTRLKHIDPRRFVIRPVRTRREDGSLKIRGVLHMSVIPTYHQPPKGEDLWLGRYVPVSPERQRQFIRIVYDDEESRLGFGRGILDVLYFYHWAKQIVIKEGLQGLERWAQGVPIYSVDTSQRGDTDQTSENIRDTALAQLAKMRARHYFVKDKQDDLAFEHGSMAGHQMVTGFLQYFDSCIMGVCTGASLRSANDVGKSGSFASDKVGQEKQSKVVRFDINKVDEDVTLDLIQLLVRVNRPQLKKVGELIDCPGLEDAGLPQFRTVEDDIINPTEGATLFSTLAQIKTKKPIKIRADEFYKKTSLTQPDKDDDVVELSGPDDGMGGRGEPGEEGGITDDPYAELDEPGEVGGPEDQPDMFEHGSPEDSMDLFDSYIGSLGQPGDPSGERGPFSGERDEEVVPESPESVDTVENPTPSGDEIDSQKPPSPHEELVQGLGETEQTTEVTDATVESLGEGGVIGDLERRRKESDK